MIPGKWVCDRAISCIFCWAKQGMKGTASPELPPFKCAPRAATQSLHKISSRAETGNLRNLGKPGNLNLVKQKQSISIGKLRHSAGDGDTFEC